MPRLPLLAAAAVLVGVAAAGWWWWTAPPRGRGVDLAATAEAVPPDAEGVLVVAEAPRLARWLARHRAAAILALAVAADASSTLEPLRPVVTPLMRTARGPLAAWWGKSGSGLSASVSPADVVGMRHLAALQGLGWAEEPIEGDAVRVWIFRGAPPSRDVSSGYPRPPAEGSWSALAKVHGRWWGLRLARSSLEAESGAPPSLPECGGETIAVSSRLAQLLAGDTDPTVLASALMVTPDGNWAARLGGAPGNPIERTLRVLAGRSPSAGDPPVTSWQGPFGSFFLSRGPAPAIATDSALLERLPVPDPGAEWGCVGGKEAARALTGALPLLDRLPGLPSRARMAAVAESLHDIQRCAWSLEPTGGRLTLQW
ncbi:MAG: hypothetical protein HRF46_12280 [Acidobacteriota bacterium]